MNVNEIGMIFGLAVMAIGLIFFAVGTVAAMVEEDSKDV